MAPPASDTWQQKGWPLGPMSRILTANLQVDSPVLFRVSNQEFMEQQVSQTWVHLETESRLTEVSRFQIRQKALDQEFNLD